MEYEMSVTRAVFQQQQQSFDSNNNNGGLTQNHSLPRSGDDSSFVGGTWPKKDKITDFFKVSRAPQKQVEKSNLLYIPAEMITVEDLKNNGGRALVTVNDKEVALVTHKNVVYAIEPKCPHVGGPIHQGDIEEVPGCGPCIKCPWHKWKFSLTSGRCIAPQNREESQKSHLQTFPVLLNSSPSKEIKIGFTQFSPKTFNTLPE